MEGAGAFNVRGATRGMDSADEAPELPSAVQDLIRRLEGEGEPVKWFPELFRGEFQEFFPRSESLSTITGWRSQVRLRVLEAIGSCDTLENLIIFGGDISRLTETEWEVVFRGFKSSTVLETISLWDFKWSSDAEVESLFSQLGSILNSSNVQKLFMLETNLSARCWLSLASGLRGNPDSKLQVLSIEHAWEDASAVKHVADMINSAPLLEELSIACKDDMEEEAVGILSQALTHSSSLKELKLDGVKWGEALTHSSSLKELKLDGVKWAEALLLNALARDDGNRSIERLLLIGMDGLGGCLRELLTSNPLKEVTLIDFRMSPEEWRKLGEFIRDNAIATTTTVEFNEKVGDNWESIEALACAASSEDKDPTLELVLNFLSEDELMLSLNLLGRVLRGEIKSLKCFSIMEYRSSGANQDRPESFLSMKGQTGEASVLKRLGLHVEKEDAWKGVWKELFLCVRGNTSLTHLDLSSTFLYEEAFRDLMGLLQVNLTLEEIDLSCTPWERDGKGALIQEALKQNQKRAAYMSVFVEAKLKFGDAKAGRLFLCGSPLADSITSNTGPRQKLAQKAMGQIQVED